MATAYTVIRSSIAGDTVDVVIEFPIPTGTNTAGIEWQRVVLELYSIRSDRGDFLPSFNPRKYRDSNYSARMLDGEMLEIELAVPLTPSDTNAQKVTAIETAVTVRVAEFVSEFAEQHKFYGYTGSV